MTALERPRGWMYLSLLLLTASGMTYVAHGRAPGDDESSRGSIRVEGRALRDLAKIDSREASEAAHALLNSASLSEPELEVDDDYLVYTVEVALDTEKFELIYRRGKREDPRRGGRG